MEEEIKKTDVREGVTVEGRYFPFKPLTVTQSKKILKKLMPGLFSNIRSIVAKKGINKRWWKRVRGVAFVRTGLWHFGIVPKELRCSVIKDAKATEIEDDFFVFAKEIVLEYERLLRSFNPSQMVKSKRSENV